MLQQYNTINVATIDCIVRIVGIKIGAYFLCPTASHVPTRPHHNSAIIVAEIQYNAINVAAIQYNHCCSNWLYCKDCKKSDWCLLFTSHGVPRPSVSTPQFCNQCCRNTVQLMLPENNTIYVATIQYNYCWSNWLYCKDCWKSD